MKINVPRWDQIIRLAGGILFVAWGVAGGPWWTYSGFFGIATGAWRICPVRAAIEGDDE